MTYEEEFSSVDVVAKYDTAMQVINWLVKNTDFELKHIEIDDAEWNGYDYEFLIQIDSEGVIWCQKARYENGEYVLVDGNIIFVHEDCNSKFVIANKGNLMIEVGIADDSCGFDGNCKNTTEFGFPVFRCKNSDCNGIIYQHYFSINN